MCLPKWLWRILRSKRVHRLLVIAPFAAIVGVVVFYWGVNAWGQSKLDATCEQMREQGIPLTEAERGALLQENQNQLQNRTAFAGLTQSDTNVREVFSAPGLPHLGDWRTCFGGTTAYPAGDLRLLFRPPPTQESQRALADQLLTKIEPTIAKFEPVIEMINDPGHPVLFEDTEEWGPEHKMTFGVAHILIFHSFLLAKSGDLERGIGEFQTVAQLIEKWQRPPFTYTDSSYRLLAELNHTTPFLVHAVRDDPQHLQAMEDALTVLDTLDPAVRAEEFRLGKCCERFSHQVTATNLAASEMDWSVEWADRLGDWRKRLSDWWWQVQPAGFTKANLSRDVDSLLPVLGRTEIPSNAWLNYAALSDFTPKTDPRTRTFYSGYSDNSIPAQIGFPLWSLLKLRFHRLAITAELYRHRIGSYPSSIEGLLPEPVVSPFTGDPVRMALLTDGRLQFEAVGASFFPDGTLHFDPTTPITFEYPPKP